MASRPPELPESIVTGSFDGVRNTVAPERLGPADLEAAVNVDIDDAGQARRRRGRTRVADGAYHSARTHRRGTLIVKDDALGWLRPDYSFSSLQAGVGSRRVASLQIGDDIYFSSESVSGVVRYDDTVGAWGASSDGGTWVSPVTQPTETLGAIAGRLLAAPPLASELALYNGRIYMAVGRVLWATELYLYHFRDKTRSFIQFEEDITLLAAVDDGLYVGTAAGLFFLQGDSLAKLKRSQLGAAAVVPGSLVEVPTQRALPQARQGAVPESLSAMFLTTDGLCVGAPGGQVYNLTRDRMVFPRASGAAALYRDADGVTQYIAVADSRGSPASSARIGDYVDAEIVRFQGG